MARGTLADLPRRRPRRRQDLRDAQRGLAPQASAAPTSSSGSSRPTAARCTAAQVARPRGRSPAGSIEYRGQQFEEMDLDAVLARAPEVALVDELAHTNVPGCRNAKRWQDIDELLAAGIDVISTVNIQHLESLNDVVEQITGVVQRETVPDAVVRAADQIELVDMTPEALRRRMAHGNIYPAEKVDAALRQLLPRREPRRAARARAVVGRRPGRRVARGVPRTPRHHRAVGDPRAGRRRAHRRAGRRAPHPARRPHGRTLARRAGRRARARRSTGSRVADERTAWSAIAALLDELGGRFAEVAGADPADALVRFARAENATQLVLGASHRSRWAELTQGSVINHVIRAAGPDRRPRHLRRRSRRRTARRRDRASGRGRPPAWRSPRSRAARLGLRPRRHPAARSSH